MSRRHVVLVIVFGSALFLAGVGFARRAQAQPKADDDLIKQLLRDRQSVRKEIVDLFTLLKGRGGASQVEVLLSTREWLWSELELCETKEQRVAVLEKVVEHEKAISAFFAKTPDISKAELLVLRVRLLDAQVTLERAKRQ